MVHTGQTAHWIRYLNEDFILILRPLPPITNKPDHSHMLSYSLMHVTGVVCNMFLCMCVCMCNADNGQTVSMCVFACVHPCMRAAFTLEEQCQSSTLTLLLRTNLLYLHRNTFAMYNAFLCTIWDNDRVFPECLPLSGVLNKHRPRFWFQW